MKKIKNYLMVMAVLLSTACEDFLDPESLSNYDQNYIFSNYEDARRGVNAIYVYFSYEAFSTRLSNQFAANTDIETAGAVSDGARYQLYRLEAQENNSDLTMVWDAAYKAIRNANIAIEGISKSKALYSDDKVLSDNMKHLLGEAYTLRAYWYSMLAFHFGDVPFITEAPKAGVEFNLPKENRNVILSSVIQDLIEIEDDMKWADQAPFGIEQVNREYTLGMIARLALQRGGWYLKPDMTMGREDDYLEYYKIANIYSKKLIDLKDRPLPRDFRQIFLNQCKFISPVNSEILFEVPYAVGAGGVGYNVGMNVRSGNHPYGKGGNYQNIPVTYFYSFDKEDIRREVTAGLYRLNDQLVPELVDAGAIAQGKWSRRWLETPPGSSTAKGTGINWPMMRYADVLLMYAETENELNGGPTGAAKEALRRVRQRAFDEAVWGEKVDQYINSLSGKESFFNAIVDERGWEFGGEMIRKYELIRWDLYHEKVSETVEALKKMADDAFYGVGSLPDYVYVKVDENGELLIYNIDEKVDSAPDETWTRETWLLDLNDGGGAGDYRGWITYNWANYTDPVRYIYPVPSIGIDNSKGVLKNDGYGF